MKEVTVLSGQCLLDIAIQELGDRERVFELVVLNGIGLTDDIEAGTMLIIPLNDYDKKEIVKVFKTASNKPASAIERSTVEFESEGVQRWTPSKDVVKGVIVYYGQTLVDIAIQELGDRERVFELIALNGFGLTDDLPAGTLLKIPEPDATKMAIVKIFTNPANKPATGVRASNGGLNPDGEGIGFWAIENDFIVS